MTERVKSDRMQFMFRNEKAKQDMDNKVKEIKRMEEIREDTKKDTAGTQKKSEVLQKHLKMQVSCGLYDEMLLRRVESFLASLACQQR